MMSDGQALYIGLTIFVISVYLSVALLSFLVPLTVLNDHFVVASTLYLVKSVELPRRRLFCT